MAMLLHQCQSANNGNYFTGEIRYAYTYESNTLNTDSLTALKPSKAIFRYDATGYQSQFIGKDTFTYFYYGVYNKALGQTNGQGAYECEDYGTATDTILTFRIYSTNEKILGHPCKIIEYQTRQFWNRYHVATDLKIAPLTYQHHAAYNWQFYGNKTEGGLILKLEHRFPTYTMKGMATEINLGRNDFKAFPVDSLLFKKLCNGEQP